MGYIWSLFGAAFFFGSTQREEGKLQGSTIQDGGLQRFGCGLLCRCVVVCCCFVVLVFCCVVVVCVCVVVVVVSVLLWVVLLWVEGSGLWVLGCWLWFWVVVVVVEWLIIVKE